MGDILPFRKQTAADKARGRTLCRNGFHKWKLDKDQVFNSKMGRLVTVSRCERCGAIKNEAK